MNIKEDLQIFFINTHKSIKNTQNPKPNSFPPFFLRLLKQDSFASSSNEIEKFEYTNSNSIERQMSIYIYIKHIFNSEKFEVGSNKPRRFKFSINT